ncbi:hypothetical protein ACOSP7_009606 [Xanthoceras sorbifolium]
MSSSSSQKRREHKVGEGEVSSSEEEILLVSNEVVGKYERLRVEQMSAHSKRVARPLKVEVVKALIFGLPEVRPPHGGVLETITVAQVIADQGGDVEIVNGVEILTNPPRAVPRRSQPRVETFLSVPSTVSRGDLKCFLTSFHLPEGHKVLAPAIMDRSTYPHLGYISINQQHLGARAEVSFPKIPHRCPQSSKTRFDAAYP